MTVDDNTKTLKPIEIDGGITVNDLSRRVGANPVEVIKNLMRMGIMASLNDAIDFEVASPIAQFYGYKLELKTHKSSTLEKISSQEQDSANLVSRPAVVTVLGHVDHGKTSVLDALRETKVAEGEAGGITQHIGAYQVSLNDIPLTFLDTPGHEAFTNLRARGANVTDIAVLVISADDGVMPQTIEAINHVKAADVPIIIAINKMDLPNADPEKIKRQLSEHEILVESWGGDVLSVDISAKTGAGLENLVESINLLAEISELKSDPKGSPLGTVIEAELNSKKGPLATILIQSGTLKTGDTVVVGACWGRIKAMTNHSGDPLKEAGPSTPIQILGLNNVPNPGDTMEKVANEKAAKSLSLSHSDSNSTTSLQPARLEQLANKISMGEIKDVNIIVKADVQGSLEAIRSSVSRANTSAARANILHINVGSITESDILLATASGAIILGFNTNVESAAMKLATARGIEIRNYSTIYQLIDDLDSTLKGMVEPILKEVTQGQAEIKEIFDINKVKIAGCIVTDGTINKNTLARVTRGKELIYEGPIVSLRHFKDEAREVTVGQECGISLLDFNDFNEGDVISSFVQQEQK
jgi:translation initiation factor IF-2